jgi:ketosteroid isomerase-like protein
MLSKCFPLILLLGLAWVPSLGQSGRPTPPANPSAAANPPLTSSKDALYQQIAQLDANMFAAFNAHNVEQLMTFFAPELEFYHDKGGVSGYSQNQQAFTRMFAQMPDMHRDLVPGSLEVYPIKDYGAVQIGQHRFCHQENGKADCGSFKFMMLWQHKEGSWKITRVISYDH